MVRLCVGQGKVSPARKIFFRTYSFRQLCRTGASSSPSSHWSVLSQMYFSSRQMVSPFHRPSLAVHVSAQSFLPLTAQFCECHQGSQGRLERVSHYGVLLPNSSQMNCLYICMKGIARTPPGRMARAPKRPDSSKPWDRQLWCSALSTRRAPLQSTK